MLEVKKQDPQEAPASTALNRKEDGLKISIGDPSKLIWAIAVLIMVWQATHR